MRKLVSSMESQIRRVAEKEGVQTEHVSRLLESGYIVIPCNNRRETDPVGIGRTMKTKINVNVGTSRDYIDPEEEFEKALIALKYGSDTIMDLSTGGNLDEVVRKLIEGTDAPIGTVPIYQAGLEAEKAVVNMTSDDMFNSVRRHAEHGVDFVTIHAGVNQNTLERLQKSERIMDIVSRGGAFTIAWMVHNGEDNPFYREYEYLLEIAKEYNLTLSLGDGMRPGCIDDASDRPKYMEFIVLGELVREARKHGIQAMVEGPGHVPLDEIGTSIKAMKHLTDNAPVYLLGPIVTDIGLGHDHITGAIGAAVAGMHGADFLCMVTPAEHLALPTIDDIRQGTIITRIAAHIVDTVKPDVKERARGIDREMAIARSELNWEKQFRLAVDGEQARKIKELRNTSTDACSMCGDLCAIRIVREALGKKK